MSDTNLPAVLEDVELGPACQKLSAKRLRFAAALVFEVQGGPNAIAEASKIAGYAESTGKQLVRDRNVIAAVEELGRLRMALDLPMALDTLRATMNDRFSKDRLKAAQMVLDRAIPTKQEIKIEATVVDRTKQTLDYLAHMIAQGATEQMLLNEFGPVGLDRYRKLLAEREAQKPIDAEYRVIEPPKAKPTPAEPSKDQPAPEISNNNDELGDLQW